MPAQGEITRRFLHAYQLLRNNHTVKSGRSFAISLNYLPQSWNEILQGRRDIPLDLLHRAAQMYQINPIFLFSGEGDPFFSEFMNEKVRIRTILVNERTNELLAVVPKGALDAYPKMCTEHAYMASLPCISMPEYTQTHGTHRCFEVCGDQMEEALFDGDKVIAGYLHPDRWEKGIRDNHVYVVVTQSDVMIKRAMNKISDYESLVLISDNNYYPPQRVHVEDIQEIWLVIQKISPFLHSSTYQEDLLREQIANLYDQMTEQNNLLSDIVKNNKQT